jgi:hypothetical protein
MYRIKRGRREIGASFVVDSPFPSVACLYHRKISFIFSNMVFQRYILVILAFALCLAAATPVLPRVDSAVQSRDEFATPTTYQAALSLVENSSTFSEEADITTKEWSSSSMVGSK